MRKKYAGPATQRIVEGNQPSREGRAPRPHTVLGEPGDD